MLKNILQKEIWEIIPNLEIHWEKAPYWVLNERAIRATAWIMMLIWVITFFLVFTTKNFNYLYPTVIAFWIQFFVSVFFGPKYAPFSIIWKFLVKNQRPEYVWAIQKRFAWAIWLFMASLMLILTAIFSITWIIPIIICFICLAFMWLESAVWICVWCKIYYFLVDKNIIKKPEYRPACPGWVCSINKK